MSNPDLIGTMERRIADLRTEYASGQEQMQQLERRQTDLRDTLLRIAGAIQVMEELLAAEKKQPED